MLMVLQMVFDHSNGNTLDVGAMIASGGRENSRKLTVMVFWFLPKVIDIQNEMLVIFIFNSIFARSTLCVSSAGIL